MKRLLLLAVCLAIGAATAQAQVVPYYADVFQDRPGGKLLSREWVSAEGNFRQEVVENGAVHIFRRDSMVMYILNPTQKTVMTMAWSQISDPNAMFGMRMTESENRTAEFVRTEDVEGYECDYWVYKTVTNMTNGQSQTTEYHHWIYKPLNTWIRQTTQGGGDPHIKRNIRQGPQSASLFEIPRDYTRTAMPGGGLLEMLTGQSRGQTEQKAGEAQQRAGEAGKSLEQALDPKKSQTEQINDVFKLLEGLKKK